MDCRRKSELKVEDMKQAEKALSATPKITSGQFNQTLQRMQEREERKRAKLARKEEEAAQKELAEVREGPTINKASEQLAARSRRRPTHHCQLPPEEPQHNSVASRKVNFRDFERRQMILEERRRERVENLVLEVAQAELEECTFKPAILNGGTPAPSDVSVVSHHTEFSPSYATDSRTPWCGVKDDLADLEETLVTWEELALDVED
ncbi:hypothetical protein AGDE_13959 [Angomonas deanei]|uniref:Uncharacterized protein n=1 Tax=Angomonas deanei TaxID=59799 RepID=A0A7G2CJN6_9TRYP|nr:hypothetical protein AGDE_13959 [Angomonas deanei]CAD2220006.1 hypothetical protein, conserved [Angomonas deanei]|eukprot:EPY21615.1 hypothetical protein AGDE_13959 [Angomonas deanei]